MLAPLRLFSGKVTATSFRKICFRKRAFKFVNYDDVRIFSFSDFLRDHQYMKCPFCANGENKVIDSRLSKDGGAIRRRRECLACGQRFTTYEFVEEVLPPGVKKEGRGG